MPGKRIPPSQKMSNEIMNLMTNLDPHKQPQEIFGQIAQLSIRKLVQELLEQEIKEHIGKDYYEQGPDRRGYRHGYEPARLKTAEGALPILKPQINGHTEPFHSQLWPIIKGRTQQLERIAVEMYARGCSTRDIEDLLKDEQGRILLSRSGVSQLNDRLWQEYEAFCKTDLSQYDVVYIFSDAVYESLRMNKGPNEGILVVWGILATGEKVLLSMRLGNKESYDDWLEVFRDLRKRGLCDPVLGTSDGAPGLIKAFGHAFPKTLRQRCLVHKKRNIINKVPSEAISEVKAHLDAVYYAPNFKTAKQMAQSFKDAFGLKYPSAVECFEEDLEACLNHLQCPAKHRRRISTTNLVERSFGEEKRRSKVIPRFFNEKSGLKLVFASLIRASQRWQTVHFSFDEQAQILALRDKLGHRAIKEQTVKNQRNHQMPKNFSRLIKT